MGWNTVKDCVQLTSVGATIDYFDQANERPDMEPGQIAHVQITSDASGTTDDLIVEVFASVDGGVTYDDPNAPYMAFTIPNNASAATEKSFVIAGVKKFQIGVRRDGATDTFTVDCSFAIGTP